MTRPALLAGSMSLPMEAVNVAATIKNLTLTYLPMGETVGVEVLAYTIDKADNRINVPRQYGLQIAAQYGLTVEDQTSLGRAIKFKKVPQPREYQIPFLDDVEAATGRYYDFIARAHTGFGKTISSLIIMARLGVSTLIVVDQDNLKDGWLKALKEHFGLTIENGGVGVIQGKVCQWDRPVVIAMVHTLKNRDFPAEVKRAFGLMIVDEVHTIGAPTFWVILMQFEAAYRFGVSATPKRRDTLQKLIDYNLGKVRVAADKEHDESAVYFVTHDTVYSWYANTSPKIGRILTEVSEDGSRNLLIADTILGLWEVGHHVIIMGDRIEQLNALIAMMEYMGVDADVMGLYTGSYPVYRYAKETKPARRPYGWEKGTEYTPVSLQLISKDMPKKRQEHTKEHAQMLFSTYGKTAKAFDEPRLSAGIDITPRSQAEQMQGRILREYKGKKKPVWVTIVDKNNYRLMFTFAGRIKDYPNSNSRIYEWKEDGELIECEAGSLLAETYARVKKLKSMQIRQNSNGRNMLVTPRSEIKLAQQRVSDTGPRTRSRKAA